MANPIITNVGLVSRYDSLAVTAKVIIDGTSISADGVLLRGTLLVRANAAGKYHAYVHGTDTVAADNCAILVDDVKVVAGQDAFGAGYREGFFSLAALLDANSGLVAGDLLAAAGFHTFETGEIRLK